MAYFREGYILCSLNVFKLLFSELRTIFKNYTDFQSADVSAVPSDPDLSLLFKGKVN